MCYKGAVNRLVNDRFDLDPGTVTLHNEVKNHYTLTVYALKKRAKVEQKNYINASRVLSCTEIILAYISSKAYNRLGCT